MRGELLDLLRMLTKLDLEDLGVGDVACHSQHKPLRQVGEGDERCPLPHACLAERDPVLKVKDVADRGRLRKALLEPRAQRSEQVGDTQASCFLGGTVHEPLSGRVDEHDNHVAVDDEDKIGSQVHQRAREVLAGQLTLVSTDSR